MNLFLGLNRKNNAKYNDYCRPVHWVIILWDHQIGVLLSQYEINYLKKYIISYMCIIFVTSVKQLAKL